MPGETSGPATRLPDLATWLRTLEASSLVGDGRQPSPMVLVGHRLYLYRYHYAESRLAANLKRHLKRPSPETDLELVRPYFRRFFPAPENPGADWQAVAATLALTQTIALVSGGPGTGKTTTVSRILALALLAEPDLRVALAAPTGKAAARLGESISEEVESLELPDRLAEKLAIRASTLHRLLRYQPSRDHFHHGPERPLSCDLLVIDEASMVDLLMMDAVVAALPTGCRLLLLGDRHQLASVETGFVFGDLCATAGGFSEPWHRTYHHLAGRPMPPGLNPALGGLSNLAVELQVNFRFQHQKGIGRLASAVRDKNEEQIFSSLDDPALQDIAYSEPPADPSQILRPITDQVTKYLESENPTDALQRLEEFRLLSPIRRGPWGVASLNRLVESFLTKQISEAPTGYHRFGKPGEDRWYQGRPILVAANDYQVRLFNGDLGVCWPDGDRLYVFFPGLQPGDELRRLPLAKLPPHNTAWAITVHKSQGSELDHVLLVLGDRELPVLSRELLYTGITRARKKVTLVTTREILKFAIAQESRRDSGLAEALAPEPVQPKPVPAPPPDRAEEPTQQAEEPAEEEPDGGQQLSLF